MEENLQSVVFAEVLQWIHAQIKLSHELKVLNIFQLVHLADVVEAELEESEALNLLETLEFADLVLGQVEGPQNWQSLQSFDLGELICTQHQVLDPEVVEILYLLDLVAREGKNSETFVQLKSIDSLDVILVEIQVLEVFILEGILNGDNLVARIVNPLKIGWWGEIESVLDEVARGIQSDQVLDISQWLQRCEIIARDIYILQIDKLLDSIDRGQVALRD